MGWDDWDDFLAEAIGMKPDEDGAFNLSTFSEKQLIKAALK